MKKEIAKKILEETKRNFNKIAEEFSETRFEIWPIIKVFTDYIKKGDKILDIGCGNGRLYRLFQEKQINIEYVGIDNSQKLIEIAKKNFQFSISESQISRPQFIMANALNLPFKDNEFDKVFMIAVLPHLPLREWQKKVLENTYRVLKKDGYLFITCWNLWQPKLFWRNFINRIKNQKLYQGLGWRDFFIPWHLQSGEIIWRFYHAFTKKELKKLLGKTGFKVEKIYYEDKGQKSNWLKGFNLVVVAKK